MLPTMAMPIATAFHTLKASGARRRLCLANYLRMMSNKYIFRFLAALCRL